MDENDSLRGSAYGSNDVSSTERSRRVPGRTQALSYTIWLVLLLLLLINLTSGISTIPLNRLLEKRLCRIYYDTDDDVNEELCKVDRVQQDLAWIVGFLETLWIVGGKSNIVLKLTLM